MFPSAESNNTTLPISPTPGKSIKRVGILHRIIENCHTSHAGLGRLIEKLGFPQTAVSPDSTAQ